MFRVILLKNTGLSYFHSLLFFLLFQQHTTTILQPPDHEEQGLQLSPDGEESKKIGNACSSLSPASLAPPPPPPPLFVTVFHLRQGKRQAESKGETYVRQGMEVVGKGRQGCCQEAKIRQGKAR